MTPTENCQRSRDQGQLSSRMFDQHIEDVTKVGFINFAAFAVSMSDVSEWLRLAGLAAAFVYTCLKIVQTVRDLKK